MAAYNKMRNLICQNLNPLISRIKTIGLPIVIEMTKKTKKKNNAKMCLPRNDNKISNLHKEINNDI